MKTNTILMLLATMFMISCAKKDVENPDPITGINVETGFELIYKDSLQNDLLDPKYEYGFNADQIKLLNIIDGKLVEFYKSNLDYPKGYSIFYRADFNANVLAVGGMFGTAMNKREDSYNYYYEITSFLQLNKMDLDTVKMEIKQAKNLNYWITQKVWYNDELKWDIDTSNAAKVIQVVK
jgi:hypothetical protein